MSGKVPDMEPMTSSMFSGSHYDPNTRALTVQFKNGAVHQYEDVPADKHFAFVGAASPGKYFNDKIKSNHAGKKIRESS